MSVLVKRSAEHLDLDEDETIDATPVDANGNAQRARTGSRHHPSEYKPGAVMKVRLHNFMTYSDVEMEPGPRLNVILGPNGTGKSSFVCALAMGLAAPTKILGRADKVAEYVKRGEEKGWCEITLRGERPDKPLVVRREMSRSAGSGRYLINGYPVGVERVKAEIKKLGCQLDNLCQFLPQDRVVAFAQLKPTELLLETEKAIGDGHLFNEHEWLINEKKAIADLEREVAAKEARIEKLNKEVENMERDVARFNERNELLEKVEEYKLKRLWIDFEDKRKVWKDAQAELLKINEQIKQLHADASEHKVPMDKAAVAKEEAKKAHMVASRALVAALKEKKKRLQGVYNSETEHSILNDKINSKEKEEREKGKRIRDRERAIADIEDQLAGLVEPPDISAERTKALREKKAHNDVVVSLETKHDILKDRSHRHGFQLKDLEAKLAGFQSERQQRLVALQRAGHNQIIEADRALQNMQNQFHKPVIGPILTLIKCDNINHRKYLEAQIGKRFLAAYITQDDRDRSKLQEWTKRWQTTAVNMPSARYEEPIIDQRLKSLGITHRLDQCFEADAVVKAALCDMNQLNITFVIDPKASQDVVDRAVTEVQDGKIFYTPSTRYTKIQSRYGRRETTTSSSPTRDSTLFSSGSSTEDEQNLKRDIQIVQEQKAACDRELNQLKAELADGRKKLEAFTSRINNMGSEMAKYLAEKNRFNTQLKAQQNALERLRQQDVGKEIETLKRDMAKILEKRSKETCAYADAVTACCESRAAETTALLHAKQCDALYKYLKELYDSETRQARDLVEAQNAQKEKTLALKRVCALAKREAEEKAPLDEERKKRFFEMPQEIDPYPNPEPRPEEGQEGHDDYQEILPGIDECVRAFEEAADEIMCPNDMVLQDFRDRQEERNRLRDDLTKKGGNLNERLEVIETKKQAWLAALRPLVDKINDNFKNNFASIGCAGEVKLHDAGDRFEEWELQIWVKFRAVTDMHILDAHRQSGGERSVSTMLYLISLQELTSAPFRVVDEINQGMDPINERKIFKRMTKAASSSEATQTFLLTPKLLNNLQYTEDCTVLCIFNGPWIAEMAKRWREMQRALQPGGPVTP